VEGLKSAIRGYEEEKKNKHPTLWIDICIRQGPLEHDESLAAYFWERES
jgi:hypothetical protein